jgi:polyferredoxin
MPVPSGTWPSASIGSRRFRREDSILIRRLAYVAFFLEVGLLLLVLPWSGFWETNYFAASPLIRRIVTNNFVRGGVSGLGIVNLAVGFIELFVVLSSRDRSGVSLGDRAGRSL